MQTAFVLMTAMPPTTGHLQLIQFASRIAPSGVRVVINTQPHEPMPYERANALRDAVRAFPNVEVVHIHEAMEQNPEAPGFWEMWRRIMTDVGLTSDDFVVASEGYGQKLAEVTGAQFFPYDIGRTMNPTRATLIRENPYPYFASVLPEFRRYLRTTVTVFGAESTGKTTLAQLLGNWLDATVLFEYARPYLESTVNEITPRSMTAIWKGQAALQRQGRDVSPEPLIVQDTDLFSTVGYWSLPHWSHLGGCPAALVEEASALRSDLYVITKSNIPFEQDPLRYGGNERESSDAYWIDICEAHGLSYAVLESDDLTDRFYEASAAIRQKTSQKAHLLAFNREHNEPIAA